jgi:membrane protease YdiL (CAAX protease family)
MNGRFKRIVLFIVIVFVLSWLLVLLFFILGGVWGKHRIATFIVGLALMFMPTISAVLVQKVIYKEPLKEPLGISFRLNFWWLVAWLLPAVIAFATIGISLLMPGMSYSPEMTGFFERFKNTIPAGQLEQMKAQMSSLPVHIFWITLVEGLLAGVTVNAVAGFGEELGWRGFLLKELSHVSFWRASVIIGLIWGIWHAPLILQGHNYPQHPVEGIFMMVIFCLLLSPLFTYVRLKSGSVVAAAILHGSLNATSGLAIMVVKGGSDLTTGVTGLAGFIVLLIADLFIFLFDTSIRSG